MSNQDEEFPLISLKEFKEAGYLQEVNRRLLHPLGLAMSVIWPTDEETGEPLPPEEVDEDDVEFGGIFDFRDDPEGMAFSDPDPGAADRVDQEMREKIMGRLDAFGWFRQPAREWE